MQRNSRLKQADRSAAPERAKPGRKPQWDADLTPQQALYLAVYTETGSVDQGMAAAGYVGGKVNRQIFLQHPPVRAAMANARGSYLANEVAIKAIKTLEHMLDDPAIPAQVRYQSARTVLELASKHAGTAPPPVSEDKPLLELSLAELEAYVTAGSAALAELQRTKARTIEGAVVRPADSPADSLSAQDDAQVWDGDDLSG